MLLFLFRLAIFSLFPPIPLTHLFILGSKLCFVLFCFVFTNRLSGLSPYPALKLLSNTHFIQKFLASHATVTCQVLCLMVQHRHLSTALFLCVSSILLKKHYYWVPKLEIVDFSSAASLGDLQGIMFLEVPAGDTIGKYSNWYSQWKWGIWVNDHEHKHNKTLLSNQRQPHKWGSTVFDLDCKQLLYDWHRGVISSL